jgi:hypothetical protein
VRGIDFNDKSHREVLSRDFPRFHPLFDYPEDGNETAALRTFFSNHTQFGWLDARALFVLIADVNRRWFDSAIDVTCIEPYPRAFLRSGIPGISRLLEQRVQDVAPEDFERLEARRSVHRFIARREDRK